MSPVPGRPRKGRRFGGDAEHQKAMVGNLVASLIAAEAIVTTEAKAKHLRPIVEKCVTKAKKAQLHEDQAVHLQRQVVALIRDKDMPTSSSARSAPATPTGRAATPAFSSSARATATTPQWRASSSYKPSPRGATRLTLFSEEAGPEAAGRGDRPGRPGG